jgi:hypothetical protein
MNKTDSITKNFLNGNGQFNPSPFKNINLDIGFSEDGRPTFGVSGGVDKWIANEDPTYLGFWVYLQPELAVSAANDNYNRDYLPQGLLIPDNISTSEQAQQQQADSIVGYLRRRNEHYRAKMMEEFQNGFIKIFKKAPWMIQKISGVDALWKINPANNFRGKDVVITFECLESIDLKMTYLLDLYRKSVWDATYHRWAVPDCQRYFMMDIVIAEIRTMQRPGLLGPFSLGTFHTFKCEYCEIDPFSEEPGYLATVNRYTEGTPATVKFKVKVGAVREVNKYGLLGAVLQDTKYAFERGKSSRDSSFEGSKVLRGFQDYFTALGGAQYLVNAAENIAKNLKNKILLGNVYGFSLSNAINALQSAINNPEAAARNLFSNAGVASPIADALSSNIQLTGPEIELVQDTIGSIEILANAVAGTDLENQSIETIVNTITSSRLQGTALGNANLTSAQAAVSTVDSVTLDSPSKNIIIDPVRLALDNNGGSLIGSPGKVVFVAPNVNTGLPASVQLDSTSESGLQSPKVELTSPSPTVTQLGQAELTAPSITNTPGGKVELESPETNDNAGGTVELEAPPITQATETKVKLLSFPIANSSETSVELTGANPSGSAGGIVELESNFESSKIQGSVDLVAPQISNAIDSNVNLEGAEITSSGLPSIVFEEPLKGVANASKVEFIEPVKGTLSGENIGLVAPESIPAKLTQVDLIAPTVGDLTASKVDLESPTINTNIEGNINLSGPSTSISAGDLNNVAFDDNYTPSKISGNVGLVEPTNDGILQKDVDLTGPDVNLVEKILGKTNLE